MTEILSTAERLTEIRADLKLSQKAFASQIGITQGALSQLEAGKSTLSLQTIQKLCDVFSIDSNWLLLGLGTVPFRNNVRSNDMSVDGTNQNQQKPSHAFYLDALIPLINEEAHAGYVKNYETPDYISTLDVYRIPGFDNGDFRMFEIIGDSMLPTIHPREIVVTEKVSPITAIQDGSLYIVITAEGIVAKRVYLHEENHFIFKSDNAEFKSYSLPKEEVLQIWAIRAKITTELAAEKSSHVARFESIESEIKGLREQLSQLAKNDNK
ncbi:XRE family transcriptional regulator [Glaciecola sp. 1036]|uniref:XRE family transcriptional regulator n=1 Tax=Alteromonadaceae TaxID=72275 RepID=UPI003D0943E0